MTITRDSCNTPSTSHETDTHKLPQNDYRRSHFTRSPSIEKIIRFNSYICSQSFFILPSLLAWLKTSQTVLQYHTDRIPTLIKSAVYSTILYKTAETQLKLIFSALTEIPWSEPEKIIPALKRLRHQLEATVDNLPEKFKRQILKATVYFCFFYIFLQLSLCLLTLSGSTIPSGLIFLLVCLLLISYGNFQCLRFIIIVEILKAEERLSREKTVSQKYIRPKDILGKRTISKMNLF